MRSGLWYTALTALTALAVAVTGAALVEDAGRAAAWLGAGLAFTVQVLVFWLLFVWLFPNRLILAHALGVFGRFGVVGVVALIGLPLMGLPAAPTLFSLVTVLFLTTLLEPVILQIASSTRR